MLFEQRIYTLKPGTLAAFWQAQRDRGFDLVRPILERQIGYFSAVSGAADQVVHLYRYDGYDDWFQRLHGLYRVAALEPYFKTVRALMLAQENRFLVAAPLEQINPLWGGQQDWLPSKGALFRRATAKGRVVVEERTTVLLPGSLPLYWQAYREHGLQSLAEEAGELIGCFTTLVGRQHQIVQFRLFSDGAERQSAVQNYFTQEFVHRVRDFVVSDEFRLLIPSDVPELSPMFA